MRELQWDEELAATAQARADTCEYEHDCNDCMKSTRFAVGQNLAAGQGSWSKAINAWYDEVKDMESHLVSSYGDSSYGTVGHYTALVWADTWKVGCGYIKASDVKYGVMYVCNYGPAGNYPGKPVYKTGQPCSDCPPNSLCSKDYPGLCTGFDFKCPADQFTCERNRQCIPSQSECDEKQDCTDGSDEHRFCPANCKDKQEEWKCKHFSGLGFCTDATYGAWMTDTCEKTCKICPRLFGGR